MTAACVEKLPCPDCGSSDSRQAYLNVNPALDLEWYTSFCHGQCWEQKGNPYEDGVGPKVHVKTEAERLAEASELLSCPLFKPSSGYRSIPGDNFAQWGVRLLLSEFDGKTPYAVGFPYSDYGELVGWKCRPLRSKDFFSFGYMAGGVDPFGMKRAMKLGGDTLWIVEGEFDAIALEHCMRLVGDKTRYPVISLTHGGGTMGNDLLYIEDRIGKFKNIVIVVDDDEVGRKAEETALSMRDNTYIVAKPEGCKDANDALESGKAQLMGNLALNFKD